MSLSLRVTEPVWPALPSTAMLRHLARLSGDPEALHTAQKDACDGRRESLDGVVFSDSTVVVIVDDMAFEFDDPDLDLDKLSESSG